MKQSRQAAEALSHGAFFPVWRVVASGVFGALAFVRARQVQISPLFPHMGLSPTL